MRGLEDDIDFEMREGHYIFHSRDWQYSVWSVILQVVFDLGDWTWPMLCVIGHSRTQ